MMCFQGIEMNFKSVGSFSRNKTIVNDVFSKLRNEVYIVLGNLFT